MEWLEANQCHEALRSDKGHVRFLFDGHKMRVAAGTVEDLGLE